MITNAVKAVGNGAKSAAQSVASGFWTVFYFFYFLAKGKPEWKCTDTDRSYRHKSCCVDAGGASDHEDDHLHHYETYANGKDKETSKKGWFSNWFGWFKGSSARQPPKTYIVKPSLWSRFKTSLGNAFSTSWQYTKRIGRWFYHQLCSVGRGFLAVWRWLFSWIRPVLTTSVPSQALPATPKPFTPQSSIDSPTYNKVFFEAANVEDSADKLDILPEEKAPVEEKEFYHAETVFPPRKESPEREIRRELSVPPPAPPPPPAKPVRVPSTLDLQKESTPMNGNGNPVHFREPKEPLMKLPQDVMAELSGAQRMRQERGASAQREMTQSCHPDMPEWKEEDRFDRSATATPFRANSVGPTMRKLEQVVSRLEDSDENEAQFVFRPKQNAMAPQPVTPTTPHTATGFEAPVKHIQAATRPVQVQDAPLAWRHGADYQPAEGYQLGKSVFSPVREAETMREQINRRSVYDSRPVTPATSLKSYGEVNNNYYGREASPNYGGGSRPRASTVGPYAREPYRAKSPFTPSAAYSNAPFASHTARRSRTPSGYDRGANVAYDRDTVNQGSVDNVVRQWPPLSNATGAPVEKDHWISDVLTESQDGLITTMARRVVEQRTSDNWKWRDDQGALVDEKNQNTWKGELDTVLRDGPNQGRHWSRRVEQLPGGDTRFQDVSRQYSDKYVVESVIRNY